MSSVQNQKSNTDLSLSFEDVSKLFSLPLSEAADILGVSTSVLKKLCNENGLERWPHRKYLAGKSIEEIKKEAAKEKTRVSGGASPAERQKNNNITVGSTASPSQGSHLKEKTPKSAPDISKAQSTAQQQGSRNIHALRPHHMIASGLAIETSTCLDEFKFGFPSNGLSRSANKWWGSATGDQDKVLKDDPKTSPEVKPASEAQAVGTAETVCAKKDDSVMGDSNSGVQVSLSTLRKRAVDEGRRALKLGIVKKYKTDNLGEEDKILFRRLFQSSFPMDAPALLLSDAT